MSVEFYAPPVPCEWAPGGGTVLGTWFEVVLMTADTLWHPGIGDLGAAALATLARNFRGSLGGLLAVYLPGEDGQRNEDPSNCVGVVIDLRVRGDQLVAAIDIRDAAVDLARYDVACTVVDQFTNTQTGRPVGPALISVDLRPRHTNRKAATTVDNITKPGIRFRAGDDGVARPMPSHLVDHHVARLSAEAEGMGLSRPTSPGTAPRRVGTAQHVARYTHLAEQMGIGSAGSVELPSMGRG